MTWAEDRATLASDPSADPGARPNGPARSRPLPHSGWHQGVKRTSLPRGHKTPQPSASVLLSLPGVLTSFSVACRSPWGALDYASCGAAAGQRLPSSRRQAMLRSDGAGPVISIRRVAHSLRTASGDSRLFPRDSHSCELTRRFPKRTTSTNKSGTGSESVHVTTCL
jgi:hypothetical protein